MKVNLLDLDRSGMERWFASIGEKPFRARQVLRWIHQRGAPDFAAMTDIARSLRTRLAEDAEIRAPAIVGDSTSADGTRKWLLGRLGECR
jgi:23S rRNA (adenine2503-C2)-methyltransferase